MSNEKPTIYVVSYTTIKDDQLRNGRVVVKAKTTSEALDEAGQKLKETGLHTFRLGTARPF